MAGNSDLMKEQLSVYEDSVDPLATKPPFGGAEAKPQNSDYPDLAPDLRYVARIIESNTGDSYPLDGPWQEPSGQWVETLVKRKEIILNAYSELHDHYVEIGDTKMAAVTGIFIKIYPGITDVAISQLRQEYHGPKSWYEANPKACKNLEAQIEQSLKDPQNIELFEQNSSIREYLELVKNVLIPSSNPEKIDREHSKFMKHCIDANAKGELIFYGPFESDYTNPVKSEAEKTQICEASLSLIVSLKMSDRLEFDKFSSSVWNLLKQRRNAHMTDSHLNTITGTHLMGAGFDVLSAPVAESFILKHNGKHDHGFFIAPNNLMKKIEFWRASSELINSDAPTDMDTFIRNTVPLVVLHEEGHRLFPEHGLYGEVSTDIPAVIKLLKISLYPEIYHISYQNRDFRPTEVVKAILTEYVSEIVNSVSEEAWFEGNKANSGNDLFDGYLLSAVVIMNAMTDSGLVRLNKEGNININLTSDNLSKLFNDLETIDTKFHLRDEETLEIIKLAAANPEADKIIDLYRSKINIKQFTEITPILQEMDSKVTTS